MLSAEMVEMVANRFKVLSDPTRLEILQLLMAGEKNVGDIVEAIGSSQPNVSKHLYELYQKSFISKRKEGVMVFYSIADQSVYELCNLMCCSLTKQFQNQVKKAG